MTDEATTLLAEQGEQYHACFKPAGASPVPLKLALDKDKEATCLRAMQLFPSADLRRKKDHGRAEALLLASYGLREYAGLRERQKT